GEQVIVCANSVSQAPDFVALFCNIWHISTECISIQTTEVVEARLLTFDGWMDNENLVYSNYVSGGSWDIFIYNSEQDEIVAHAGIHVGDVLAVSDKYVVTASGADYYFERSAAVFNTTPIREDDRRFFDGPYIRYLSFERGHDQFEVRFNSTPLDWLAAANQLLVLTWETDAELWNVDLLHDSPVTDLQLWDVEADTLTLLVPGAVDGRFSPDGRFLAFLTPGNPAPFLQLLNRIDGTVSFAVQTIDANISFSPDSRYAAFFTPGPLAVDASGVPLTVTFEPDASYLHLLDLETMQVVRSLSALAKIVLWSPDSRRFVYQTPDGNLAVFDVHKGHTAPIANSSGERLSNPQWSFDGSYLSVQVRNAVWWETAVLRIP
ncbi:MAG: hypothetical protein KC419_19030, partial [Anaerolineales bacterium]|nr:hypothetical protein [Anaerolineales bacterium]